VDFTEALKTVTYILRVHRQGEKIRWTSQKHWKQPLTCWGCTDKEKRSGRLHGSTEHSYLHTEGAQTRRKDQVNFTEALKTVTYMLRVHRPEEKIRLTSQKHWKQSLTCWECTDKEKRSGGLHRSTENSHWHTEGAQTRRKHQVNFTEALKTITYILRGHRQGGKDQVEFIEVQKHLHVCTAFTCALYYQPIVSICRILPHSLANHSICQQNRGSTKGRE